MDKFEQSKKAILESLYKPDRSRKGAVDEDAKPVIDALNSKDGYYTTSSCSGRISLFHEPPSKKKPESGWLFVKHDKANAKEIVDALKSIPDETVWFRQETPIFHVACRDIGSAKKLLEICRDLGFKRAGIIGDNTERVMVEIIFNDKMDVPIASNGQVFVEPRFLEFLVKKANEKFERNNGQLKRFEKEIRKRL